MPTQPSITRSAAAPAAATETTIVTGAETGDRSIAYTEYGDPDGTPVLFFHGTPGSRLLAELLDPAATNYGVRLIAFDRPGYGRSDPHPDRTVRDAGTNATAVLDAVEVETAGLIGFSGGCAHALATAATHPDRVEAVDCLAGITPPQVADSGLRSTQLLTGLAQRAPRMLAMILRVDAWIADRRSPSAVISRFTAETVAEPVPDRVARIVTADLRAAVARSPAGAVTEFRTTASAWEIPYEALAEAAIDVRFHHGDADTNAPLADVRQFVATVPTADLQVLDGADHLRTLTRGGPTAIRTQSQL